MTNELYPDLLAAGGLDAALSNALTEIDSPLVANGLPKDIRFVVYGRVECGNRFSQVYTAAKERLFLFDFWRDGVHLANGATPNIIETAQAINKWVATECSLDELGTVAFVTLNASARAYDEGREAEQRWSNYLTSIGETFPELVAFVNAAAQTPQLRQLFPFTSLNRFCFSRCTGYPFTRDTPNIHPKRDGTYDVVSHDARVIGNGNATVAVQLVVSHLPPHCGPAVRGTAETMKY